MLISWGVFTQSNTDTAETLISFHITRSYNEVRKQFMAEGAYFT